MSVQPPIETGPSEAPFLEGKLAFLALRGRMNWPLRHVEEHPVFQGGGDALATVLRVRDHEVKVGRECPPGLFVE